MKRHLINLCVVCFATLIFGSCSDILNVNPGEVVLEQNRYKTPADARSAMIGVYGEALNLVDQYVVLGELRGDLVDVTPNANENLKQINEHRVEASNPYADISVFYKTINACNDAMANFQKMKNGNLLDATEFAMYYNEVATLRCWIYYNLVLNYGEVPYITTPMTSENMDQSFPKLNADQMADTLIKVITGLPNSAYDNLYPYFVRNESLDGVLTAFRFINRAFLLGDLYLWKGDYLNAATVYKNGLFDFDPNTINLSATATDFWKLSSVSGYVNPTASNWPKFFLSTNSNTNEVITFFKYNKNYDQRNGLQDLFCLTSNAGQYLLKPSMLSVYNWLDEGDVNRANYSYKTDASGNYYVYKYSFSNGIAEGIKNTEFDKAVNVSIYRAGGAWLHYIEAINRCGKHDLALSLLNNGPKTAKQPIDLNNTVFNFDTLTTYKSCLGIRGRVFLAPVHPGVMTAADSMQWIENKIYSEEALELAYEGSRWPDLLRRAHRMEQDGYTQAAIDTLANTVAKKFNISGSSLEGQVRTKLQNKSNWYLPLPAMNNIKIR